MPISEMYAMVTVEEDGSVSPVYRRSDSNIFRSIASMSLFVAFYDALMHKGRY